MYVCVWLICHFTPMEAALTAAQGRVQSSGDPQTLEAPTPPSEKKVLRKRRKRCHSHPLSLGLGTPSLHLQRNEGPLIMALPVPAQAVLFRCSDSDEDGQDVTHMEGPERFLV